MTLTLRSFAAVPAFAGPALIGCILSAACAMPASASSHPVHTLFHHSATAAARTQYVAIEFRNVSPQQRSVQIGENQFRLAAGAHQKVSVAVGSLVKVRSEVNSKVDGKTLLTVDSTQEGQEVLVN